jgi:hypothetical protein
MTTEAAQKVILEESWYKQGFMAVDIIAPETGASKMVLYKYHRYRKV